jgi:hypothetical protein
VVRRADDAFGLHELDDAGSAVVADLQVALRRFMPEAVEKRAM